MLGYLGHLGGHLGHLGEHLAVLLVEHLGPQGLGHVDVNSHRLGLLPQILVLLVVVMLASQAILIASRLFDSGGHKG